jgi:hypothetical protein
MMRELGFQGWQAMDHFFSDGDYLGFNESDYRGAIAEYQKAWELLSTPWQQQTGGPTILEGVADFALQSEDPDLATETMDWVLPRAIEIVDADLQEACERLSHLARQRERG